MGQHRSLCAPWATSADVSTECAALPDIDDALLIASEILNNLTGGAWPGECEDVIRPVAADYWNWRGGRGWAGWGWGMPVTGVWTGPTTTGLGAWGPWGGWDPNPSTADQARSHSSRWLSEIRLPSTPVVSITEVLLDGVILDPTRYRLANRRSLVMTPHDGDAWQAWPTFQDDRAAPDQPRTFQITYRYGDGPPPGGVAMAKLYGCQIAQAGLPGCQLPQRVQTITRQGVSMTVLDPLTLTEKGMVGLPTVDMWVASVWARRRRRPASVTALDRRKPTRRDQPAPEAS